MLVAVRERSIDARTAVLDWLERVQSGDGDRHLPYTIVTIFAIALLGLVVVPLSIPDPLPEPEPEQVLAERYLLAFSATGSPTLAQGLEPPADADVVRAYGVDGGTACTGSMKQAYDTLVTTTAAGGVTFDKAAFARMKVAHSVYCPERTAGFAKFVKRRSAINAQAARARTADPT